MGARTENVICYLSLCLGQVVRTFSVLASSSTCTYLCIVLTLILISLIHLSSLSSVVIKSLLEYL